MTRSCVLPRRGSRWRGSGWRRRRGSGITRTGEWKDGDSLFLTCNVWRQAAENVAESLTRGMRVIVSGRLRQRSYETKEGEKRTVYEVEVDDVGPSLRNASAKVNRIVRSGSGDGGYGGGQRGSGGSGDSGGRSSGGQGSSGGGYGGGDADPWASDSSAAATPTNLRSNTEKLARYTDNRPSPPRAGL